MWSFMLSYVNDIYILYLYMLLHKYVNTFSCKWSCAYLKVNVQCKESLLSLLHMKIWKDCPGYELHHVQISFGHYICQPLLGNKMAYTDTASYHIKSNCYIIHYDITCWHLPFLCWWLWRLLFMAFGAAWSSVEAEDSSKTVILVYHSTESDILPMCW
jgi:hypothetical protein